MNTSSKDKLLGVDSPRPATAEQQLRQLGIKLPTPPEPFGIYAEAVQTGNLLFLTGMLPTVGREAEFIGRIGAEVDVQTGRRAAYLAGLNALAVVRQHLGSLDQVTRIVRLGVLVATSGDVREQPKIADGASELLQDVFGRDKNPSRLLLIRLFQQGTSGSVGSASPAVSEDSPRVSVEVCHRGSVPAVFGRLSLAGWFRVSALRERACL
jgi:enamine deaminase RidA (YjgF/YER057c/UK114 family)